MNAVKEQFIINEKGDHVAIIIPIEKYNKMMEALEDLEDIRDYEAYIANKEDAELMPIEKSIELRKKEKKNG